MTYLGEAGRIHPQFYSEALICMSTFVLKDGILAADSRAFSGGSRYIGLKTKIFVLQDKTVVGCSTNQPGFAEAFSAWVAAGMNPNPAETPEIGQGGFEALVIDPEGNVFYFNDGFYPTGPLTADFFAIGSGAEYAMGALECGASAEQAVAVACKFDHWTAEPVTSVPVPCPAAN